MSCWFGVDGGGTKSRIRLVDEQDTVLYEAEGGATNIYAGDHGKALENLAVLIEDMASGSGIPVGELTAGCISSAGLDRAGEKTALTAFLRERLSLTCPLYLCNDGEPLLVGGLGGLEGICLIAGTGSLGIGRLEDGTIVRSGGLGYMLGDEGSAYWIAHQGIKRILRSLELRDLSTDMLSAFLEFYHLTSSDEFVKLLHHDLKKGEIASSAKIVSTYALRHDPLAEEIIRRCVEELAKLLSSVIRRLPQLQVKRIIFSGGVLEHDELIRGRLVSALAGAYPEFTVVPRLNDAVTGACMLARLLS